MGEEKEMNRAELREGLVSILNFLQVEEQTYQECLNRYIELIDGYKQIILFGGGIYGLHAASILKERLPDKEYYFIDNDKARQGQILYQDIKCFGIEKLDEFDSADYIILITGINSRNEIYSELTSGKMVGRNLANVILKDFGFLFCKVDYEDRYLDEIWREFLRHKADILNVFDSLVDDESCFVYYRIFVNRITRRDTFWEIYSPNQYFIPEICEKLGETEVFIDCGSYIGETLENFKKFTKDRFLKAYEFELDEKNFGKLTKNNATEDNRVVLINKGVGDREETIEYAQFDNRGGSCGFAFAEHDVKLGAHLALSEIRSLDSLISEGVIKEKVTFVKMDIEGAEMQALKGMANMIRRDMPKLAICIYHRPQDMWEIPLYIRSIAPDYRLIIRHHDHADNETVLYAVNG